MSFRRVAAQHERGLGHWHALRPAPGIEVELVVGEAQRIAIDALLPRLYVDLAKVVRDRRRRLGVEIEQCEVLWAQFEAGSAPQELGQDLSGWQLRVTGHGASDAPVESELVEPRALH